MISNIIIIYDIIFYVHFDLIAMPNENSTKRTKRSGNLTYRPSSVVVEMDGLQREKRVARTGLPIGETVAAVVECL